MLSLLFSSQTLATQQGCPSGCSLTNFVSQRWPGIKWYVERSGSRTWKYHHRLDYLRAYKWYCILLLKIHDVRTTRNTPTPKVWIKKPLKIYKNLSPPKAIYTKSPSIPRLRTNIVVEAMDTSKTRTQNGLAAYAAPEINGRILWSLKYGVRQWQHMHATKTKDYIRLVVPWTNDHMTKLWNSHEWPYAKISSKKKTTTVLDQLVLPTCSNPLAKIVKGGDNEQKNPLQGPVVVCDHLLGRCSHRFGVYILGISIFGVCRITYWQSNRLSLKHHLVGNMTMKTMKTYENHIRKNNTLSKEDQRSLHLPPALHDVAFLGWIFYDSFKKVLVWVTSKYQGITLVTRIWNCNHLVYGRLYMIIYSILDPFGNSHNSELQNDLSSIPSWRVTYPIHTFWVDDFPFSKVGWVPWRVCKPSMKRPFRHCTKLRGMQMSNSLVVMGGQLDASSTHQLMGVSVLLVLFWTNVTFNLKCSRTEKSFPV